jgi:hypothetical protein
VCLIAAIAAKRFFYACVFVTLLYFTFVSSLYRFTVKRGFDVSIGAVLVRFLHKGME